MNARTTLFRLLSDIPYQQHHFLISIAIDFAEHVAHLRAPHNEAATKALETARAFLTGTATRQDCRQAALEAYLTTPAYYQPHTPAGFAHAAAAHAAFIVDLPPEEVGTYVGYVADAAAEAVYYSAAYDHEGYVAERKWQIQHLQHLQQQQAKP